MEVPITPDPLCEHCGGLPVWIRAPARGHEHYTGLTRPKLYELAANGHIRTCCIHKPGRTRGMRLFHLASMLAFIETHCEAGKAALTTQPCKDKISAANSTPVPSPQSLCHETVNVQQHQEVL